MVLLAGPRRVGRTTLARGLPGSSAGYLDRDVVEDRARILRRELPYAPLWIFDEIHRYRAWREHLEVIHDARGAGRRILAAGSA
jgi:predicted AAA+ superfamily ATPase